MLISKTHADRRGIYMRGRSDGRGVCVALVERPHSTVFGHIAIQHNELNIDFGVIMISPESNNIMAKKGTNCPCLVYRI